MVEIDSKTLFNGAAALVSTIAILFFVANVDLGYSPASEVALVAAFLAGIFLITQRTRDRQLTLLGYGVIVTASVGLFFDLSNTFEIGDGLTVLGLLGIAGLLFALRSGLGSDNRFVSGRRAAYLFGVVAVIAAAVIVVDVATGSLAYELQPQSEVEYDGDRREAVRVATVTVTNPTPLPERVEIPNYRVCTAGDWSAFRPSAGPDEPPRKVESHVSVQSDYREHVFGYGAKTYPVELHLEVANATGETFPVRTTEACPDGESGAPYLALFEAPEDNPYARPV